ncbi:MAG: hypothetical protein KF799_07805 [Bdellovibrionales bacterium]|nr:hypothetical protein [Bdellovibrionales bacterium]
MKSSLNVIRAGLAATMCISLLAACDGRGSTAFKSYREAPEVYAARIKAKAEADRMRADGDKNLFEQNPEGATLNRNAPPSDIMLDPAKLPGAPASNGTTPAPSAGAGTQTPSDKAVEGPKSKFWLEFEKLEPEQRKVTKRETLTRLVDGKVGGTDAQALAFVKEISFSGVSSTRPLQLSLKAALAMDGQERFLFVEGAPVDFDKDGDVIPLDAELHETREMNGEPMKKGEALYALAFCPSADCGFVQVVFDFATKSGRSYAVFILEVVKDAKDGKTPAFKIVGSNLGPDLKPFADRAQNEQVKTEGLKGDAEVGPVTGESSRAKNDAVTADAGDQGVVAAARQEQVAKPVSAKNDETFDQFRRRQQAEAAKNQLNLPEQTTSSVVEMAKAGVAPSTGNLFKISSSATQEAVKPLEFRQANTLSPAAQKFAIKGNESSGSLAAAVAIRNTERAAEAAAATKASLAAKQVVTQEARANENTVVSGESTMSTKNATLKARANGAKQVRAASIANKKMQNSKTQTVESAELKK